MFLIVPRYVVVAQGQVDAAKEKLMMLNETIVATNHDFDVKQMRLDELQSGLPDLPTPAPEGEGGNNNGQRRK